MSGNNFFGIKKGLSISPTALPVSGNLGDIVFNSATNKFNQWSGVAWVELSGSPPLLSCKYATTAGQTITSGSPVTVVYGTQIWNNGLSFNSLTGELTCLTDGKYRFTANLLFTYHAPISATDQYEYFVRKNGSTYAYFGIRQGISTSLQYIGFNGSCVVDLLVGDITDLQVLQSSGVSLALLTNATTNNVTIERIGD